MADEKEFRIVGDPNLRVTPEEMEAQKRVMADLHDTLKRNHRIRDIDPDQAKGELTANLDQFRQESRVAEDVRAGLHPDMHMPDDKELAEIEAADPDTAYLFRLGQIKPGSAEFTALHVPPPEPVIDVLGPKGPEGFGVVRRLYGVGPRAGELLDDLGAAG